MTDRRLLRTLTIFAGLVLTGSSALAQSAACARYRAELAAIDSGNARPVSPAAERQRVEIGRMTNYFRSIGCEGGPLAIFGVGPPPECGAIAQRIRSMEANYARIVAEGEPSHVDLQARRQELLAAIQQTCAQQDARVSTPGSFLERLFGPFRQRPDAREDVRPEPGEDPGRGLGGRRLVCVRSCDGFFFPISTLPGGRERADEMCRALCPGSETAAYAMPDGDNALDRAVSLSGKPYTQLPTAFKYTKSVDPSCSCKGEGESWAAALQRAEEMLGQRGDIVVTAEKADEMSRPKAAAAPKRDKDRKAASRPANEVDTQAAADLGAAAPTASRESSGIGPQSIESGRVIARTEGPKREVTDSSGAKRTVRVVGPQTIPVPETR